MLSITAFEHWTIVQPDCEALRNFLRNFALEVGISSAACTLVYMNNTEASQSALKSVANLAARMAAFAGEEFTSAQDVARWMLAAMDRMEARNPEFSRERLLPVLAAELSGERSF